MAYNVAWAIKYVPKEEVTTYKNSENSISFEGKRLISCEI